MYSYVGEGSKIRKKYVFLRSPDVCKYLYVSLYIILAINTPGM